MNSGKVAKRMGRLSPFDLVNSQRLPTIPRPAQVGEMTKFIRLPDDFDFTNLPYLCSESHRTKPMVFGLPNDKTRPYIRVTSGDYGIASKEDGKILNALRDEINRRQISGCVIRLSADDLLLAAGFSISEEGWKRLQEGLQRLKSTSIMSQFPKDDEVRRAATSYINGYRIDSQDDLENFNCINIGIEISSSLQEWFIDPKRSFDVDTAL